MYICYIEFIVYCERCFFILNNFQVFAAISTTTIEFSYHARKEQGVFLFGLKIHSNVSNFKMNPFKNI